MDKITRAFQTIQNYSVSVVESSQQKWAEHFTSKNLCCFAKTIMSGFSELRESVAGYIFIFLQDYYKFIIYTYYNGRCGLKIEPMDWVMKIKPNSKNTSEEPKTLHCHLQCFSCQICDMRFCVGDPFYFVMGKIVCSKDRFSTNLAS